VANCRCTSGAKEIRSELRRGKTASAGVAAPSVGPTTHLLGTLTNCGTTLGVSFHGPPSWSSNCLGVRCLRSLYGESATVRSALPVAASLWPNANLNPAGGAGACAAALERTDMVERRLPPLSTTGAPHWLLRGSKPWRQGPSRLPCADKGLRCTNASIGRLTWRIGSGMPADPLMDAQAKVALNATKALHKRMRDAESAEGIGALETSPANFFDWQALKKLAADANRAVQAMQRIASDQAVQSDVRESILRGAVHDELIDREANAARVLDRQRLLAEGRDGAGAVFERALTAAQQIEANIGALCPHQAPCAPGVALLANR
jgi:hypothetical protein